MIKLNSGDLAGKQFGRLTVLEKAQSRVAGKVFWKCVCECGKQRIIQAANLRSGNTRSCGCMMVEQQRAKMFRHGYCGRKDGAKTEYVIWSGMKARCYNATSPSFKNYGARGISVCERWRTSFINFIEDMGRRPRGKSLDRINNDGNYEPGNCRWATLKQQSRNSRKAVFIEAFGNRLTPAEWELKTGVKANTITARLARYTITPEDAVSEPTLKLKSKRKAAKGEEEHTEITITYPELNGSDKPLS